MGSWGRNILRGGTAPRWQSGRRRERVVTDHFDNGTEPVILSARTYTHVQLNSKINVSSNVQFVKRACTQSSSHNTHTHCVYLQHFFYVPFTNVGIFHSNCTCEISIKKYKQRNVLKCQRENQRRIVHTEAQSNHRLKKILLFLKI